MPNSVSPANPTQVMPQSLSTAFATARDWTVDSNQYAGGEYHGSIPLTYDPAGTGPAVPFQSSRRSWQLTKRLTWTDWTTLLNFWTTVGGCQNEFWFYDPYETSPYFFYDASGSNSVGRYAVRFNGDLAWAFSMARPVQVNLALLEVA
jgi:hypothetical protein